MLNRLKYKIQNKLLLPQLLKIHHSQIHLNLETESDDFLFIDFVTKAEVNINTKVTTIKETAWQFLEIKLQVNRITRVTTITL